MQDFGSFFRFEMERTQILCVKGGKRMPGDFWSVRKMKNGDERALEAFVRAYYPSILKYCYRHVFDVDAAEDLTQETFEHFFGSLDRYRHYGKALNYLYVVAGNLCKNYCRKKKEIVFSQIAGSTASGKSEEAVFVQEGREMWHKQGDTSGAQRVLRMDLERAVAQLPEELREVVLLHYFQELKQREIAEILGIGLPLVKYRIKKAREQLKDILGQEYV